MVNSLMVRSLVLALGLFFTGAAHAATITVTGTGDTVAVDGVVTLREAIISINGGANTNADVVAVGAYGTSDTINFGIAGAGAHVISVTSALPSIIKPVTINGYSQGPGTPNSAVTGNNSVHNLVIDGTGAGAGVDGLTLAAGSSGSTIRGLVIDSFGTGNAILISNSKNNIIAGNFIGTDNNGGFNAAAANNVGVSLFALVAGDDISGNQIGGSTPADRNVISNNTSREIALFSVAGTTTTGILVQNNYLGMNAAGTTAIGGGQGVLISGIQGATIGGASGSLGGSCSGVCNLIAGSAGSAGLVINDATSSGNLIQGNFFGTDVTGTLARSNGSAANINISATSTVTIGGTAAGTGNLISGETVQGKGILIDSGVVGPVNIQGNFIGTTTTGNATLGNGGAGISITGSTNVNIGGTTAAARNVIGGNGNGGSPKLPGIFLEGNGPANATAVIQGNNIGIGADGTSNVGNIGNGIDFTAGSTGSTVGASTSGGLGGNIIAFNGAGRTNGAGVAVAGGTQAKIFSNSIFSNTGATTGIGIDLSATGSATDGPTANDACDGDTGGNNLQNFPILTGASSTGASITIVGTLNSTASTTFTIEFFANSSGSQGRTRLGSTSTTTNGACNGSFNATLAAVVSAGVNITATATDPSGNTSEFSAAFATTATPTAANSTIAGRITDISGNPVEGAAVRLSGTQTRLTVTDSDGRYRFDHVETNGLYVVTPSRANFVFGPSQRSFSALSQHTDAAFNATATAGTLNPLDTTEYFVRQQYLDFLGREPDEAGLNFWVNNIQSCGADAQCKEVKRIDTSTAFFLSIEFQETGYLVYRMYQASYGDIPGMSVPIRFSDFGRDTQRISNGVIVNQDGWQTVLDNNKQAFASELVQRAQFASSYPTTMSPAEFVNMLLANADITPSDTDRTATIQEFGGAATTTDLSARARALRRVAENSVLMQREFNPAFVLMEYFGYLRRDANSGADTNFDGYNFWLTKLGDAHGNFQSADMVKAFLVATEYRQRFPR
jgi:hypothetical protein